MTYDMTTTTNPILVVDDDPQMRSALKEAVQRMGIEAVVAEDGRDALQRLAVLGVLDGHHRHEDAPHGRA